MKQLPRTLYYSDVQPRDSGAGSSLVYRLLKHFPAEKLRVVTPPFAVSVARGTELTNCQSTKVKSPYADLLARLQHSRFAKLGNSLQWLSTYKTQVVQRATESFDPQAVLTVAHGSSWHTAVKFAQQRCIPYFLIVHDLFESTLQMFASIERRATRAFCNAYRDAKEVFCVSNAMANHYGKVCGRMGRVLLPGRDRDNAVFENPKIEPSGNRPLTIGYAGGLHNQGYRELVERMARIATELGIRFAVFGPDSPNIEVRRSELLVHHGALSSSKLITALRESVDILFSPQSYTPSEKRAMEINFPSKLADYSAVGLPLLIWGPSYASSVRWAKEYEGVAVVVESDNDVVMKEQVQRLLDMQVRRSIATRAMEVGRELFSADTAFLTLAKSISKTTQPLLLV